MGYDQDLNALMSSEIFRNYLQIELEKEASAVLMKDKLSMEADQEFIKQQKQFSDIIEKFAEFELSIKENRFLKQEFLNLQKEISSNEKFANELGSQFVNAIMMLDLEDSGE